MKIEPHLQRISLSPTLHTSGNRAPRVFAEDGSPVIVGESVLFPTPGYANEPDPEWWLQVAAVLVAGNQVGDGICVGLRELVASITTVERDPFVVTVGCRVRDPLMSSAELASVVAFTVFAVHDVATGDFIMDVQNNGPVADWSEIAFEFSEPLPAGDYLSSIGVVFPDLPGIAATESGLGIEFPLHVPAP